MVGSSPKVSDKMRFILKGGRHVRIFYLILWEFVGLWHILHKIMLLIWIWSMRIILQLCSELYFLIFFKFYSKSSCESQFLGHKPRRLYLLFRDKMDTNILQCCKWVIWILYIIWNESTLTKKDTLYTQVV